MPQIAVRDEREESGVGLFLNARRPETRADAPVAAAAVTRRTVLLKEFGAGECSLAAVGVRIARRGRAGAAAREKNGKDDCGAFHRMCPSYEIPKRKNERLLLEVRPHAGLNRSVMPFGRLHATAGAM